ncbi:hypothetical protein OC861_001085 [Tilletia horrida]|nr:hypothetical protein OC861_001085 [Tilletia horrida]
MAAAAIGDTQGKMTGEEGMKVVGKTTEAPPGIAAGTTEGILTTATGTGTSEIADTKAEGTSVLIEKRSEAVGEAATGIREAGEITTTEEVDEILRAGKDVRHLLAGMMLPMNMEETEEKAGTVAHLEEPIPTPHS